MGIFSSYLKVESLPSDLTEQLLTVRVAFTWKWAKTWLAQTKKKKKVCQKTPTLLMRQTRDSLWWHPIRSVMPCGTQPGTGYRSWVGAGTRVPSPTTEPSIMPPSYAIIFALRPISTWEQCKLFKTRFSGLAIIIMMISISVAIASDYLAGNFAAWGRGSSRELTCIVRSEGVERERDREREIERELMPLINKV